MAIKRYAFLAQAQQSGTEVQVDRRRLYTRKEAQALGLERLTHWLPRDVRELSYLMREHERINQDQSRVAVLIIDDGEIAIFVNPI
jgi:hypothetical protein